MSPVAIIFDNFGPYHLARLRAAGTVCDLLAIEVAGKSATYAWKNNPADGRFRRVTLFDHGTSNGIRAGEIEQRLHEVLKPFRPAVVVVPGWASPAAWGAMTWCLRNRVPMVVMSESTAWDEPRSAWKEWIKSRLVSLFSAALVGGVRHRDYLATLGMAGENIHLGYDAVDNSYFSEQAALARSNGRPLPKYFLSSARFVEKKNLPMLLRAYARYRSGCRTTPWSLVLLGDGELRGPLEKEIKTLDLQGHVQMPGFKQYDELPTFYARAGAFIHPSTIEPWGLVVNEAAASGLPLLISNRCGCAPELVQDNVNGFLFDPADEDELTRRMIDISAPDFPRADFGHASAKIAARWGPERFAQGLLQAIQDALSRQPRTSGFTARALLRLLYKR